MTSNSVLNKILKFAGEEIIISVRRLRTLTLTNKNTIFKIWGTTLDGEKYNGREVFTFNGPSRNPGVGYNYNAKGYMIMFDANKGENRTFVYDRIEKLELNGITYKVK
tara:strand:+ start:7816 stop:8139 length:324 start_codon:yes stop_codon:yes gene_type:complete